MSVTLKGKNVEPKEAAARWEQRIAAPLAAGWRDRAGTPLGAGTDREVPHLDAAGATHSLVATD
jgi:hypothetical protein